MSSVLYVSVRVTLLCVLDECAVSYLLCECILDMFPSVWRMNSVTVVVVHDTRSVTTVHVSVWYISWQFPVSDVDFARRLVNTC